MLAGPKPSPLTVGSHELEPVGADPAREPSSAVTRSSAMTAPRGPGIGGRGSRPLARRTSSWWMKNSSPLTTLRMRGTRHGISGAPARSRPPGGKSLGFLCSALGVGPAVEVLAQHQVRGEIGRRPPLAQRGRVRTQLEQQVTELGALANVDRFGQRDGRGDCTCSAKNSSVRRHASVGRCSVIYPAGVVEERVARRPRTP